jgi:uncharacterized protein DUF6616
MAKPIYKVFIGKPTEAWYQLSQEEQNNQFAKVQQALEQVGGKSVVACDSSWTSEQWLFFGVEEFPDIEAVQSYSEALNKLNWFRYIESMTLLGTAWRG